MIGWLSAKCQRFSIENRLLSIGYYMSDGVFGLNNQIFTWNVLAYERSIYFGYLETKQYDTIFCNFMGNNDSMAKYVLIRYKFAKAII